MPEEFIVTYKVTVHKSALVYADDERQAEDYIHDMDEQDIEAHDIEFLDSDSLTVLKVVDAQEADDE